ncbi:PIN domain-containing protein [Chitinophaga sp. 22536]|uniref:PIN domain-containing protein n=1 Tax=unclassified Chitinophaga TaxID=2619133 RepID=UPI003F83EF59
MHISDLEEKAAEDRCPTSYCDTSFLMELEDSEAEYLSSLHDNSSSRLTETDIVRKYCNNSRGKTRQLLKIAQKAFELDYMGLCYSTLCTMEYVEVKTREGLLGALSEATSARRAQRTNSKELGRMARGIYSDFMEDPDESLDSVLWNLGMRLFGVLPECCGGDQLWIEGCKLVDIVNFSLTDRDKIGKILLLSKYQIGMADIMHLLVAEHFGCTYFLTFDQDFNRAKEEIWKLLGLKIMSNPDEIVATLLKFY